MAAVELLYIAFELCVRALINSPCDICPIHIAPTACSFECESQHCSNLSLNMGIPGYLDARRDSCFLRVKVPPKHGHLSECPAPVAAQGVTFGMLGVALGGFLL